MGRRIAEISMEPQYIHLQKDEIHPFQVVVWRRASNPREIRLRSVRTRTEATYSPNKVESKDLLEQECMKAVENLQAY
jgi:hypothetical protein